jgi:phosphoribosylaminoimidazole-succinocarboxamide synthase
MLSEHLLRQGLQETLFETEFPELGQLHRGKVRDSYVGVNRRTIIVSDRVSAFDVVLGTVPFKGQVLNGLANYWFKASAEVCPNHLLDVPDPAVSVVEECKVIQLEMVVRAYLTGSSSTSIWTHYQRGARDYCGVRLPDGLHKHERLAQPIITPTTKAAQGQHDELISAREIVARGLASAKLFEELSDLCRRMFAFGTEVAARRGLLLVDTKYELGTTLDGELVFVDEVHTPDSSRYWYEDGYERAMREGTDPRALDKEYLRRQLIEIGFSGEGRPPVLSDEVRIESARRYVEVYELLTGQPFQAQVGPALERIKRNLGLG